MDDQSKYGNRYNRAKIVRLYKEGWTVGMIARAANCHKSTIYNHLDAAGVKRRDDRLVLTGPAKREICGAKEHSMKDELEDGTPNPNVRIDCNGNRHCRACENRRNTRKTMNNIIKRHIAEQ